MTMKYKERLFVLQLKSCIASRPRDRQIDREKTCNTPHLAKVIKIPCDMNALKNLYSQQQQ